MSIRFWTGCSRYLLLLTLISCADRGIVTTPRLQELNRKISDPRDDPVARVDRGYVYCLLGDKRRARADFNRAIELKPEDAVLRSRIGWGWFNADEPRLALNAWQAAVGLSQGKSYYDDYVLAIGHWAVGDFVRAIAYYDEAVKRDDRFGEWEALAKRTETWTQKEKTAIYGLHDLWRKTYKPD